MSNADAGRGSGLGSSIYRAMVKVHGGTITASNRPGGGYEFSLRRPRTGNALKVDLAARLVSLTGVRLQLTPLEYKRLVTLMKHLGRVLPHRFLLKEVWGPTSLKNRTTCKSSWRA